MKDCSLKELKGDLNVENPVILGYYKYKFLIDTVAHGGYVRVMEASDIILLDGKWTATNERVKSLAAKGGVSLNSNEVTPDEVGQTYCTVLLPKYTTYTYSNLEPVGDEPLKLSGYEWITSSYPTGATGPIVELVMTAPSAAGGKTISGLNYAPMDKLYRLQVKNYKFAEQVDITQLGAGGYLNKVDLTNCGRWNDLVGSLDNLGKSNCDIFGMPYTKNVSIDLVTFVANNRSAGRTTGSKSMPYLGNVTIKVNGVVKELALPNANTLAWTADSITLNGTPVEEL